MIFGGLFWGPPSVRKYHVKAPGLSKNVRRLMLTGLLEELKHDKHDSGGLRRCITMRSVCSAAVSVCLAVSLSLSLSQVPKNPSLVTGALR